jgi:hypothetical protein
MDRRRTFLTGAGAALSTLLVGCLSGGDTSSTSVEYETFQVGAFSANQNPLGEATAAIDVFTSASAAREGVSLGDVGGYRFDALAEGQRGTAREFIEATAYDTEILVSVVTLWPKLNSAGVEVTDLVRTDDRIEGTAVARGEDSEEGDDAPVFPLALVRVAVGDERPTLVEMTVTDGTGTEDTVKTRVE